MSDLTSVPGPSSPLRGSSGKVLAVVAKKSRQAEEVEEVEEVIAHTLVLPRARDV